MSDMLTYFDPGQHFTARATTDLVARRLVWFAAPTSGSDQLIHATATRPDAEAVPAGATGFSVKAGEETHVLASGVIPLRSSTEAAASDSAYAASDGTVSNDSEAGARVGTYVRPTAADADAVVKLHLS